MNIVSLSASLLSKSGHVNRINYFFIFLAVLFVMSVLLGFTLLGFYCGKMLIYRTNKIDRQKIELRYGVYTKNWLANLNIKIYQIFSTNKPVYLRIYMLTPRVSNGRAIIFHHGITANHVVGYKHAKYYLKKGYTFFCYDSRGYGDNQFESYGTYGVFEVHDLLDVVQSVRKMKKFKSIIMHGESMGGFTILKYAVNYDQLNYVSGYITESAYVTFKDVIKFNFMKEYTNPLTYYFVYPILNLYYFYKTGITIGQNTIDIRLHNLHNPVLAIHSFADNSIPINQYYKLINNVQNIVGMTIKKAPHCLASILYRQAFYTKIDAFLKMIEKPELRLTSH